MQRVHDSRRRFGGPKGFMAVTAALTAVGLLAGCGAGGTGSATATETDVVTDIVEEGAAPAETGTAQMPEDPALAPGQVPLDADQTITFVNQKTGTWEQNEWPEIIGRFNEVYPNIHVNVETLPDYDTNIAIRMNGADFGDVLVLPSNMDPRDYSHFFTPLGTYADMSQKFIGLDQYSYDGLTYAIPLAMHFEGMLYNKCLFEEAGVEGTPSTPEEFLDAMQKIKDNTDAIPFYTNYGPGWPLTNWDNARFVISGDPDTNNEMVTDETPWAEGRPLRQAYQLLYDLVDRGLVEADPVTSDWDESRQAMARGEIGVLFLGDWITQQVQDEPVANPQPECFDYMASPWNVDGVQYAYMYPDYSYGINANSSHQAAARAFVDWFAENSDYTGYTRQIPPTIGAEWPEYLQRLVDAGVQPVFRNPAPEGETGLFERINNFSQILGFPESKRAVIDSALGTSGQSFDQVMENLNNTWADAIDMNR